MHKKRFKINISLILTFIFLVLKLINVIDWSWLWIISPLWFPFVLIGILMLIPFLYSFILKLFKND